ncbi:hypothetical protein CDG77_02970 [Nostoc sp. 'Peltigera membranacea cyanobiont' 213]|uniref:hypothetical protein n=1 Tax=Nostoc sp. 'Peltigera membranacea cyanobiont' 213 TaxID=2014530 RepID=UPI000B95C809|nr:hypothetical protein [Nostoc sp. 'Peltigera membranacea cyanobiont' 213]OYD99035.1 hypothetical protein CDG77_02970 [Nostoc sp. 'Peltigera membranacea cyanobiont' 213]
MCLVNINQDELNLPELGYLKSLKLEIERISEKSVELLKKQDSYTFVCIFRLPNDAAHKFSEVQDLINNELLLRRKNSNYYGDIKLRVAEKVTWIEVYEKINQLYENLRYQISEFYEKIELSGTDIKEMSVNEILERLKKGRESLDKNYSTNINEFISSSIIPDIKNKIKCLEYEIGQLEKEEFELAINKARNLVERLEILRKDVTRF